MFRLPFPVTDDPEAPDEFRSVLAARQRWWRAGNDFHQTLRSALYEEFVAPLLIVYRPYVLLAERYGCYDLLFVMQHPGDPRHMTWQHWSRHFTRAGAERYMRKVSAGFPEMKVVERD